ncbi:MAG: hypothetical protein ACYTAN_18530 [Planctomycetota bacterium]|jgi:hypothetical protein
MSDTQEPTSENGKGRVPSGALGGLLAGIGMFLAAIVCLGLVALILTRGAPPSDTAEPVRISPARRSADFAACRSNLRQLGYAIGMYQTDYNEQMPTRLQTLWDRGYARVLKIFLCPANDEFVPYTFSVDTAAFHYARVTDPKTVSRPGEVPVAYDRHLVHSLDGRPAVSVLFFDLHVAGMTQEDLLAALDKYTSLYDTPPTPPEAPGTEGEPVPETEAEEP